MKINRFGKAEILNPQEITLLFTEGLVKPRDRFLRLLAPREPLRDRSIALGLGSAFMPLPESMKAAFCCVEMSSAQGALDPS